MKEQKNELEELIRLARIVAKPYYVAVWILSILLLLSVGANVYLATIENVITIDADNNVESYVEQSNRS